MATMKITYNGNVIDERDMSGNPAILYNGKIIGDVILDNARTLETENTVATDDIIIGSAVLNCKDKALKGDIEIVLENTFDPVLENNTWEQISQAAKSGQAASLWSVGDTKTYTCNNVTYTAQIIGFDHDNVTDSTTYGRAKAGITFQNIELLLGYNPFTNGTLWNNSYLKTNYINKTYIPNLTEEMRSAFVSVNKVYKSSNSYSSTSAATCSDTVFILSVMEIFGTKGSTHASEGTRYAFYTAGNSRIKKYNGTADSWMTRSLEGKDGSNYYFAYIDKSGNRASTRNVTKYAPAFCI